MMSALKTEDSQEYRLFPQQFDEITPHCQDAPVDVTALAMSVGVNVYQADWNADVSGKLVKNEHLPESVKSISSPSGWNIIVNSNHHKNRIRFTIAHELGHFFLHRNRYDESDFVEKEGVYHRKDGVRSFLETEANRFAAELLMPFHLIQRYLADDLSVSEMAERFGVSVSAMKIRLGLPT